MVQTAQSPAPNPLFISLSKERPIFHSILFFGLELASANSRQQNPSAL